MLICVQGQGFSGIPKGTHLHNSSTMSQLALFTCKIGQVRMPSNVIPTNEMLEVE